MVSATNKACSLIKTEVGRIGLIDYASLSETKKLRANPAQYKITEIDFCFLATCLQSQTSYPSGLAYHRIENSIREINNSLLQISAVKLERMGYVEKTIETDEQDGYDFYSYMITELGIDTLIKNEDQLHLKAAQVSNNSDDDIPF